MIPPRSAKRKPQEDSDSSLLARRARANTTIGFSPVSASHPVVTSPQQQISQQQQHPYRGNIASPLTPGAESDRSSNYFKRISLIPEHTASGNDSSSNINNVPITNNIQHAAHIPSTIIRNNSVSASLSSMYSNGIPQIQRKQSQTQVQTNLFFQRSANSSSSLSTNSTGSPGNNNAIASKSLKMDQIMYAGRKLLFVSSEIYSSVKKFNSVGNNEDSSLSDMIGQYISNCKKKINLLVEVLEQIDNNSSSTDLKSPELVISVLKSNIIYFKKFIDFILKNLSGFVQWHDLCFIRLFLLSIFGCYNELVNVHKTLFQEPPKTANISANSSMTNINTSPAIDTISISGKSVSSSSSSSSKISSKNEILFNVSNISRKLSQRLSNTITESSTDIFSTTPAVSTSNIPSYHQEALMELVQVCQRTQTFADAIQKNLIDEVSITKTSLETFIATIINFLEIFKKLLMLNESENGGLQSGTISSPSGYSVIQDLRSFRAEMSNLSRASKDLIYITSH